MTCHAGCRCWKCVVVPDPPMVGAIEAEQLREGFEATRRRYREIYPFLTVQQIADAEARK